MPGGQCSCGPNRLGNSEGGGGTDPISWHRSWTRNRKKRTRTPDIVVETKGDQSSGQLDYGKRAYAKRRLSDMHSHKDAQLPIPATILRWGRTLYTIWAAILTHLQEIRDWSLIWIYAHWIAFRSTEDDRAQLLEWVRSKAPGSSVSDFSTTWRNGVALVALLEGLLPAACSKTTQYHLLNPKHSVQNVELGFSVAHKYIGIKPNMKASEIAAAGSAVTERKLVCYITMIKLAMTLPKMKAILERPPDSCPKHDPLFHNQPCLAKGMGLILAVKGRCARFNIYLKHSDFLDIVIEIRGPNDSFCTHRITFRSPHKTVNRVAPCPPPLSASLSPEQLQDDASLSLQPAIKIPLEYEITGRKISVTYVPRSTGKHKLSVFWHGQHLNGSPYTVTVDDSLDKSPESLMNQSIPFDDVESNLLRINQPVRIDPLLKSERRKVGRVISRRVIRRVVLRNGEELELRDNEPLPLDMRTWCSSKNISSDDSIDMDSSLSPTGNKPATQRSRTLIKEYSMDLGLNPPYADEFNKSVMTPLVEGSETDAASSKSPVISTEKFILMSNEMNTFQKDQFSNKYDKDTKPEFVDTNFQNLEIQSWISETSCEASNDPAIGKLVEIVRTDSNNLKGETMNSSAVTGNSSCGHNQDCNKTNCKYVLPVQLGDQFSEIENKNLTNGYNFNSMVGLHACKDDLLVQAEVSDCCQISRTEESSTVATTSENTKEVDQSTVTLPNADILSCRVNRFGAEDSSTAPNIYCKKPITFSSTEKDIHDVGIDKMNCSFITTCCSDNVVVCCPDVLPLTNGKSGLRTANELSDIAVVNSPQKNCCRTAKLVSQANDTSTSKLVSVYHSSNTEIITGTRENCVLDENIASVQRVEASKWDEDKMCAQTTMMVKEATHPQEKVNAEQLSLLQGPHKEICTTAVLCATGTSISPDAEQISLYKAIPVKLTAEPACLSKDMQSRQLQEELEGWPLKENSGQTECVIENFTKCSQESNTSDNTAKLSPSQRTNSSCDCTGLDVHHSNRPTAKVICPQTSRSPGSKNLPNLTLKSPQLNSGPDFSSIICHDDTPELCRRDCFPEIDKVMEIVCDNVSDWSGSNMSLISTASSASVTPDAISMTMEDMETSTSPISREELETCECSSVEPSDCDTTDSSILEPPVCTNVATQTSIVYNTSFVFDDSEVSRHNTSENSSHASSLSLSLSPTFMNQSVDVLEASFDNEVSQIKSEECIEYTPTLEMGLMCGPNTSMKCTGSNTQSLNTHEFTANLSEPAHALESPIKSLVKAKIQEWESCLMTSKSRQRSSSCPASLQTGSLQERLAQLKHSMSFSEQRPITSEHLKKVGEMKICTSRVPQFEKSPLKAPQLPVSSASAMATDPTLLSERRCELTETVIDNTGFLRVHDERSMNAMAQLDQHKPCSKNTNSSPTQGSLMNYIHKEMLNSSINTQPSEKTNSLDFSADDGKAALNNTHIEMGCDNNSYKTSDIVGKILNLNLPTSNYLSLRNYKTTCTCSRHKQACTKFHKQLVPPESWFVLNCSSNGNQYDPVLNSKYHLMQYNPLYKLM